MSDIADETPQAPYLLWDVRALPSTPPGYEELIRKYIDSEVLIRQLDSLVQEGVDLTVALLCVVGAYASTHQAEHAELLRCIGLRPVAPIILCSECPHRIEIEKTIESKKCL